MPTLDSPPGAPSPPKGITPSPSIFNYQTRILERATSTRTHRTTPGSTSASGLSSLSSLANKSPPSTPIRQNVAKMVSNREGLPSGGDGFPRSHSRGLGLGMGGKPSHVHRANSTVSSARGQWEAKINDANGLALGESAPPTPRSLYRSSVVSPSLLPSPALVATPQSPSLQTPSTPDLAHTPSTFLATMSPDQTGSSASTTDSTNIVSSQYKRSYMSDKTPTSTGVDSFRLSEAMESPNSIYLPGEVGETIKARPHSVASAVPITQMLSPNSTGSSNATSTRSQQMEDTLAVARANALKRAEERRRARAKLEGGAAGSNAPVIAPSPVEAIQEPSRAPFGNLFTPPAASAVEQTPTKASVTPKSDSTPLSSAATDRTRSSTTPISIASSAPSVLSHYKPSGLSASAGTSSLVPPPIPSGPTASKDKYGSLSRSDNRRLGRHLPRIASGGEGWDDETAGHSKAPSTERKSSSLGKGASSVINSKERQTPTTTVEPQLSSPTRSSVARPVADVLTPSKVENKPAPDPGVPKTPTAGSKRRSAYMVQTPKAGVLSTPRAEIAGAEMKGLMSAVGSLSARGDSNNEGEAVTGMSNRLRLTRKTLPPSASSSTLAPAPLPSRRLIQTSWMDRQRHAIAAYEYLCHVGEAQQWIEGCLDEDLGFGVTEMEDGLRDGVILAKLARVFRGDQVVRKIWTESKHRYKQTDNINAFIEFLKSTGMPHTFLIDPIDLYEKKNIPKVIFSIHVLSHMLAREGLAERIGNLVGQFEFTDEQLAKTSKEMQGVAMPNFGDARKTLAKEASWAEPDEPEETEEEIRDRLLLECEPSIIALQSHLRGRLASMRTLRITTQLELAEPILTRFQARSRGALTRKCLLADRDQRSRLHDFATSIQAVVRGKLAAQQWRARVHAVHSSEQAMVHMQAQVRGVLARIRQASALNALDKAHRSVVALQSVCRGCLARQRRGLRRQALAQPHTIESVTSLQAALRGRLHRQAEARQLRVVEERSAVFVSLQSHLRGVLVRRSRKAREEKIDDVTDHIVAVQAAARGLLARRKKETYVKAVQQAMPMVSNLQAIARARLAKQAHQSMQKALAKVEVAGSVGGLQAFLRSKLAKRQAIEQKKKLEFVQPDVIGFQAVARGFLARQDYREWRDYLQDPHTQGALVFLQSLIRGFLARRRHYTKVRYIHRNVDKIITVQALWRGRTQRQMYDRLFSGVGIDVATIKNYMHLLDDTDADFQRQLHTDKLRHEVFRLVRENQTLETEVKDLDTKIALILKNKMTFEDLVRARHGLGHKQVQPDDQAFRHEGNRDPFTSGAHLDRTSQRKLELFEHLFFTLQTKSEYLSRLLFVLARDDENDKEKRLVETVTLTLFGHGHERREDYLFHKLLQYAVHEEILRSKSIEALSVARFGIIPVATQYIRTKFTPNLQEMLVDHVLRVVEAPDLDLSTDPSDIYRRLINEEESRTGMATSKDRNLDGNQVLQTDEHSRALYIQHLQELRHLTKQLLETVFRSTHLLPYTVRLLAREALLALRIRYPDHPDEELIPIVARTVVLPFILPAIIAPESYGIAPQVGAMERCNLAAIANLVSHVAAQNFADMTHDWFVRTPLQEYIRADGKSFDEWVRDVAAVDPLEAFFHAHELFENTSEAKPILITRTEIYGMLSILMKNMPVLTAGKKNDPVGLALTELEGPPVDFDRSKNAVSLRLTNRLAALSASGDDTVMKELWVQAKRHVIAVLRIQSGKTLFDVLLSRPEEEHEQAWLETVYNDIERERIKKLQHALPRTPVEAEYQIESIRSLPFHEVKSRAIEFCMKLERAGKLTRADAFQGLLVSIAGDIRQKHHQRRMQLQNAQQMEIAYDEMRKKHKGFEEQIKSYHEFIDSSMASLQKGKKKPTFLSKQYFHQRSEAKSGRKAKFGTYKYTAQDLYQRGVLLGINQLSPTQFSDISIIIASNEVGVFSLEMTSSTVSFASNAVMGREELRMEDLLQAQFENEQNIDMFGQATFSINMLIHQINKKFYSS